MKGKKTSSLKSPFTKIRKLHENIQITLVNMLTLLCNLMMKIITKSINIFAQRKKDVMFFCYTISGVNKFLSRHQTFRDSILLARSIGHVKNECSKPRPIETQLETLIFVFYYLNNACSFHLKRVSIKDFFCNEAFVVEMLFQCLKQDAPYYY